jgi:F0F1-type ATP synthase assembly protein I
MILGGLLVGYLLDDYFGTSPWLLIAITGMAFTGAFIRLIQWMRFFSKEHNDKGSTNDYSAH